MFAVNPHLLLKTVEDFASLQRIIVEEHIPAANFPALVRKHVFDAHTEALAMIASKESRD